MTTDDTVEEEEDVVMIKLELKYIMVKSQRIRGAPE